jgi:hypothetical protein
MHSIITMQQHSARLRVRHGHELKTLAQQSVHLPNPVDPLRLAFLQRPQVRLDRIGLRHPPYKLTCGRELVGERSRHVLDLQSLQDTQIISQGRT